MIRLQKPTPPPDKGPEPVWRVRSQAAQAERRAREARGELLSTDQHIEGIGPTGEPRHEGVATRDRSVILEASALTLLGTRMTPRGGLRPVLRTWFTDPATGEGYEVRTEVTQASLDDAQPEDEVLLHATEQVAGTIEEDRRGRRIPRPDAVVSRWYRAKVHAPGSWELA